jgi:type VI secretion system protein ImpB
MPESLQHKLDRVRPPRVQITYDVEIGGAIEKKELPFVAGIMADLSGANTPDTLLKERKFVELDRDNFSAVMESIAPSFKGSVTNHLKTEGDNLALELTFNTIDDFTPSALVRSVPELARLINIRQRLSDLLTKLDGNDAFDDALLGVVSSPEELKQLKSGAPAEGEAANA